MEDAVTAADANRAFSKLLRDVREGRSYVVTSHGKPVARIAPVGSGDPAGARGRDLLLSRLSGQTVADAGRWTRDELYADGE